MADLPVPDVGDEDVLVRVRACGVCGSDVHGYDGSTGRRVPPLVMGHEAAGIIDRVGANVRGFGAGDRVTFNSTISCGQCRYCRDGLVNLCDVRRVLGVSCKEYRRDGAFAEFVSVPARTVHRLPDTLPFEHAALIEPLSVAMHAVDRHEPAEQDAVVVFGCGMIGLLAIQVLRGRGRRLIIAVDVYEERRRLARRFGAVHTLDGRAPDLPRVIRGLTSGQGADVVLEAVGRTETVQSAVRCARKGGTVTLIGNLARSVELPLQDVVTRELALLGSCASSGEYPACIDLMTRGVVDVAPLISVTAPLEEGPMWFERLHRGGDGVMKVVLQP